MLKDKVKFASGEGVQVSGHLVMDQWIGVSSAIMRVLLRSDVVRRELS